MYQLIKSSYGDTPNVVKRLSDGAFIPFDPANTDYQQFKIQVADGTPLEDPDGNVMTQEQVDEFLRTIP
jgi:hypothetical protein